VSDDDPLVELVRALGATEEELVRGSETGNLGPLALELAMRTSSARVGLADAAAEAGLSMEDAAALWRALAESRFGFERLPPRPLKGLPSTRAYRVSRR
jgi:hypothetical protein